MNIDVQPRRCGKSFRMVQLSAARQIPIVCPTKQDADRLMTMASVSGHRIPEPVCLADLQGGKLQGLGTRAALVDDADRILALLLKVHGIMMATWTDDSNYPLTVEEFERTKASWNPGQFKREYLGDFKPAETRDP